MSAPIEYKIPGFENAGTPTSRRPVDTDTIDKILTPYLMGEGLIIDTTGKITLPATQKNTRQGNSGSHITASSSTPNNGGTMSPEQRAHLINRQQSMGEPQKTGRMCNVQIDDDSSDFICYTDSKGEQHMVAIHPLAENEAMQNSLRDVVYCESNTCSNREDYTHITKEYLKNIGVLDVETILFPRRIQMLDHENQSAEDPPRNSPRNSPRNPPAELRNITLSMAETQHETSISPYLAENIRRDALMPPLATTKVVVVGAGGGAPIPVELVKCGVSQLSIFDHDILDANNLIRHPCGPKYVGIPKAVALKQYLEDMGNTHLKISPFVENIFTSQHIDEEIATSDLLIVATDTESSKFYLSELAVKYGKPAIFVGMFEKGCGGEIFAAIPNEGCYCCLAEFVGRKTFINEYVQTRAKEDCSSVRDTQAMPGLGADQGILCHLATRKALDILIKNKQHSLPSIGKNWIVFSISGITSVLAHSLQSLQMDIPRYDSCVLCGNIHTVF